MTEEKVVNSHKYTNKSIFDESSIWSRLFFGWVSPMIQVGKNEDFSEKDLF